MTRPHKLLGNLSQERFLDEFWQQKPLFVKNALPQMPSLIGPDELAGFAMNEEIHSRLIVGKELEVEYGPISEERFLTLPENNWSLLVDAMDLWSPKIKKLLNYFDFLPSWRLDDIMVSYAVDGGNVGAHFDHYDVFLIQGLGEKSWKLGGICDEDTVLSKHDDLKIIHDFKHEREFIMSTGDMLYLPPRYAHYGITLNESITYSVGFRMPSCSEILSDLAVELNTKSNFPRYISDPRLKPIENKDHISSEYLTQIRARLSEVLDDDELLLEWFARYMTEPKYPESMDITNEERIATIELSNSKKTIPAAGKTTKKFKNGRLLEG